MSIRTTRDSTSPTIRRIVGQIPLRREVYPISTSGYLSLHRRHKPASVGLRQDWRPCVLCCEEFLSCEWSGHLCLRTDNVQQNWITIRQCGRRRRSLNPARLSGATSPTALVSRIVAQPHGEYKSGYPIAADARTRNVHRDQWAPGRNLPPGRNPAHC